jgi:sulfite reductase (NADPH) hemoprotein beta-component
MYRYDEFDTRFVHQRAAQFRDQLERHLAGQLADDDFRALRLQNGWYVQRHAPMARIAVPYGELSSKQLRALARVAREFDGRADGPYPGKGGFGHFTTRQNCQFNWIALADAADVMDVLADAGMHGIQTSGNCIRNITSDCFAGVAADEIVDPRPYCEILRQWSTLHPEFAFLPRKFKIAVSGASETAPHRVAPSARPAQNGDGEINFRCASAAAWATRSSAPCCASWPWRGIWLHRAIVRVYQPLRPARQHVQGADQDPGSRGAKGSSTRSGPTPEHPRARCRRLSSSPRDAEFGGSRHAHAAQGIAPIEESAATMRPPRQPAAYTRWPEGHVHSHRLSGWARGDAVAEARQPAAGRRPAHQMDLAADLADRLAPGELRVSHPKPGNAVIRVSDLPRAWQAAREATRATPNIGYLTDMIAAPAAAWRARQRSIPLPRRSPSASTTSTSCDISDIDLHSGCINSCGHHHSNHIGILGVDKGGRGWYRVSLGGADGSTLSGPSTTGKVIGPSFAADEVPDVIEAVIDAYRAERDGAGERFITTVRRVGIEPFKVAANGVRRATAVHA